VSLFDDGIAAVERFTGWPCFGVVPWLKAASRLPAEDSVVLERLARGTGGALKIAVPVLPRIANFDDLDPLRAEPDVDLSFVRPGERLPAMRVGGHPARFEIDDRRSGLSSGQGWDDDLTWTHVRRGGRVIGICGGYQMLGLKVQDPAWCRGRVLGNARGLACSRSKR
jgi:adenosylcobyric acid synthase